MVSAQQMLVAAATLGFGFTAPTAQPDGSNGVGFSVRQVANPNYAPEDHLTLYRRALEKANPKLRKRAATASGKSGSVSVNAQFQVPVKVGNQYFLMTFDTGSSDFWLLGDSLSSNGGKHTYYKPSGSAKKVSGGSFKISYADGSSASGDVYADSASIGTVSVTGQDIGHATQATSGFTSGGTDGLVGLGPGQPTVKPGPAKTFMDTFAAQGGKKFFAVDLANNAPGVYDFGMTDKSRYSGDIAYAAADLKSGYWLITTDDKIKAIVDTGTTVTVLPKDVASKYWGQVKSAKSRVAGTKNTETIWDFDCSETLPPFPLKVGGKTINVPGSAINMGASGSAGRCTGGLQVNTDFADWNIIGDMFIRGLYVVYDFGHDGGKSQVGFAEKAAAKKSS